MALHTGTTQSVWTETVQVPQLPTLNESANCEVCIVGAGITGMSCAYMLARENKSVIVLDDRLIAAGETERTTAHLTNEIDNRYLEIERMHGLHNAHLAYESQTAAIDQIEENIRLEQIACDFKRLDGYLFSTVKSQLSFLTDEFAAAKRAGFPDIELVEKLPFHVPPQLRAIRFPHQARFHILKYMTGLMTACLRRNCKIFERTRVTGIKSGRPIVVQTESGNDIRATSVIVATNSPISDFVKIHTKQAAYRTFVIAARIAKGTVPDALYWDTEDPYHYVRLQEIPQVDDFDMLIVGGEDHKTGQKDDADQRFLRLERWMREYFPSAGKVEYRWSGQIYEPVDGLGYIGRDPAYKEHVYISTGDSGMGMTHGTISGILLRDLILGQPNPWAALYDPSRKAFTAAVEYIKENVNAVSHYVDHFKKAQISSGNELGLGEGAIITRQGEKVAVHKDNNGIIRERSALCTHLKGIVCWNSCEQSWDCPVHGSRFDVNGDVLNGPASSPLPEPKHKPAEEVPPYKTRRAS